MSSLGDLLLGKVSEPAKSPPSSSIKSNKQADDYNDCNESKSPPNNNNDRVKRSPPSAGGLDDDTNHQSIDQKVFPSRIEKNNIAEDCQSNASSVDDYVAELLDPNDRPRNVWHVVEGPKDSPPGRNNDNTDEERAHIKRESDVVDMKPTRQQSDVDDDDSYGPAPPRDNDREHRQAPKVEDRLTPDNAVIKKVENVAQDNDKFNLIYTPTKQHIKEEGGLILEDKPKYFDDPIKGIPLMAVVNDAPPAKSPIISKDRHVDEVGKDISRRGGSRERSSSSRRHRHDRDSHRDRDRDRRSDRDRRRSPDRHGSKSSRRRRDYSDDEDEDRRKRQRGAGRSRRHGGRRSRSRSRSTSMSRRRRDRSGSRSQSPATLRNSRTILIMQLSARVEERDLEDHFSDIGRVREVRLILDSKTRRHKGIAYIEFEDAASATKALALNGQMFHGVAMQIQSALLDKGIRGGGGGGGGSEWQSSTSSSSHRHPQSSSNHTTNTIISSSSTTTTTTHTSSRPPLPPNSYRVYMGGLHVGISEEMLRTIVEPFGMIHKVEVIKDRTTGFSRGYAFVTFGSIEDGQEAVRNLDGFELAGKNMRVSKSTEKIGH